MPQNEITGLSINRCPWFHFAAPWFSTILLIICRPASSLICKKAVPVFLVIQSIA